MLRELGEVKNVCGGELFLHLVKLVGAHGVEVAALQLTLEELGGLLLINEQSDAAEVVGDEAVVLLVSKVDVAGDFFGELVE